MYTLIYVMYYVKDLNLSNQLINPLCFGVEFVIYQSIGRKIHLLKHKGILFKYLHIISDTSIVICEWYKCTMIKTNALSF